MTDVGKQELMERIEKLEAEVEEQRLLLRHALAHSDHAAIGPATEDPAAERPGERAEAGEEAAAAIFPSAARPSAGKRGSAGALTELFRLRGWEWWLNKVGIGLLLFGVVFLFQYSVDRGWLTPPVRVGIGLLLGAALVWLGLRVYESRRAFSQVLLGGGIGTFYITGFAAFQLYALVPYAPAFAFMVVVTLLAFALSIRQDGVALCAIGAAGGFGTPFLLYDGSGGTGGLVLYTALILTGATAIYLYRGWRSLLFVSAAGTWAALFAGHSNAVSPALAPDRTFLQAGALFAVLALWLVPSAREVLRSRQPGRWPTPEPGNLVRSLFGNEEFLFHSSVPAHLLSLLAPAAGLAFTREVWDLSAEPLGWVAFGGAAAYAGVAAALRRLGAGGLLYYTNALVALLLSTLGMWLVLEGNALFLALAVEAAVLHLVSRRLSDGVLSALAHLLFLAVGFWLAGRIVLGTAAFWGADRPFLNLETLVDLCAIALALGVSNFAVSRRVGRLYAIAAHAAVLGLLWRELAVLPEGAAYVTVSWGVYAAGLLILGLRRASAGLVRLAAITLLLVAGKLFLVDLVWVSAAGRILLFLGFGGLFLVLGYYLQALWKTKAGPT